MPVPAIGPVASWAVYDLSLLPRDRRAINSRVLKYTSLTKNLTRMMASVFDLYLDPPEVENFASRLTWIMLYFYGARQLASPRNRLCYRRYRAAAVYTC